MKGTLPEALPHPLFDHLASLKIAPPAAHPASFFDPPTGGALQPVIEQAVAFVESFIPAWAANHSYRVYAYGLAFADYAGWSGSKAAALQFDKEIWFLAAIMHDIGWDEESMATTRLSFEIWGGITARGLLRKWGAPNDVADEVCESIIRHTEGATSGAVRVTGAMLQLGPVQDFGGVAVPHFVNPEDNVEICRRWPRLGVVGLFHETMATETGHKPGCVSTIWSPRALGMVTDNVACFVGIQGERTEDAEWKEKRKQIQIEY